MKNFIWLMFICTSPLAQAADVNTNDLQKLFEKSPSPTDQQLAKHYLCKQTSNYWYLDKENNQKVTQLTTEYTLHLTQTGKNRFAGELRYLSEPTDGIETDYVVTASPLYDSSYDDFVYHRRNETLKTRNNDFTDRYHATADGLVFETYTRNKFAFHDGALFGISNLNADYREHGRSLTAIGTCTPTNN
jgi:hypothetical protein